MSGGDPYGAGLHWRESDDGDICVIEYLSCGVKRTTVLGLATPAVEGGVVFEPLMSGVSAYPGLRRLMGPRRVVTRAIAAVLWWDGFRFGEYPFANWRAVAIATAAAIPGFKGM